MLSAVTIAIRGWNPRIGSMLSTDEATLAASNPLDLEWVSGKGDPVRLTD